MDHDTAQAAFIAARCEIANPELDSVNPHFGNRYASLGATLQAIRGACAKHGMAYVQLLESGIGGDGSPSGVCELTSYIFMPDGARMRLSAYPVAFNANPQAFGSNLTYTKRQQAQADWGIWGEDDDGEAGAATPAAQSNAKPKKQREAQNVLWRSIQQFAAEGLGKGKNAREIYSETFSERRPEEFTDDELLQMANDFDIAREEARLR